jgi:hypothetical protein
MAWMGEVVSFYSRLNRGCKLWRQTREGEKENEMHGLVELEVWEQRREEIRKEVAVARPEKMARENRETRPYVVRDLSWELARYLDTESFSSSASATLNSPRE